MRLENLPSLLNILKSSEDHGMCQSFLTRVLSNSDSQLCAGFYFPETLGWQNRT